METIKKLAEAAKICLDDLKSIDSKVSVTEGNLAFLASKKATLTSEIEDLEKKKSVVQDACGTLEKNARADIELRLQAISAREGEILSERAMLKTKLLAADGALAESEGVIKRYAELYNEYLAKASDLNEKRQILMATFK